MKKIYFLLTAIPLILTACSDSSSPTGTQEDEDESIKYSTSQKENILVIDSVSVPDTVTENSEITLYYTIPEQCISPEFSSSFEETPTQDSLYIEILYSLTEELTCPTEESYSIMPFSDKEKPDSGAVSCIITYCDSISEDTIPASSEPGISTTENYKTLTRDINDTLTSVKYLFLEELEVFYQR